MSDHNPGGALVCVDALPDELQDWDYLPEERIREPWDHFAPFLASHGYFLAHTEKYKHTEECNRHIITEPRRAALDPFHPADHEDFVHRRFLYEGASLLLPSFFQQRPTHYIGSDSHQRNVYIKAVPTSSPEWKIIQYLSSDPLRADPRNHTIPNVEILCTREWVFIIQAYWGTSWQDPPMDTVGMRLKMGRQLLEGLVFMHDSGVSHGDIHNSNVVWNHDDRRGEELDVKPGQPPIPFQSTFDCRFAFIDFGCAVLFPPDAVHHVVSREHIPPSHFAAPEQSNTSEPYDAFAADVFNLGKVLRSELDEAIRIQYQSHSDSDTQTVAPPAYLSLLEQMTKERPDDRPSAQEALRILEGGIQDLTIFTMSSM